MRPGKPPCAAHDDVRLTRHERRAIARLEAGLRTGRAPVRRRAARVRFDPAAVLRVGLVVLAAGALATSPLIAVLGIAVSLGALLRAVSA